MNTGDTNNSSKKFPFAPNAGNQNSQGAGLPPLPQQNPGATNTGTSQANTTPMVEQPVVANQQATAARSQEINGPGDLLGRSSSKKMLLSIVALTLTLAFSVAGILFALNLAKDDTAPDDSSALTCCDNLCEAPAPVPGICGCCLVTTNKCLYHKLEDGSCVQDYTPGDEWFCDSFRDNPGSVSYSCPADYFTDASCTQTNATSQCEDFDTCNSNQPWCNPGTSEQPTPTVTATPVDETPIACLGVVKGDGNLLNPNYAEPYNWNIPHVINSQEDLSFRLNYDGGSTLKKAEICFHGDFEGPGWNKGWVCIGDDGTPPGHLDKSYYSVTETSFHTPVSGPNPWSNGYFDYESLITALVNTGHSEAQLRAQGIQWGANIFDAGGACFSDGRYQGPGGTCSVAPTCRGRLKLVPDMNFKAMCVPNQTVGDLKYDVSLSGLIPEGFERATFFISFFPDNGNGVLDDGEFDQGLTTYLGQPTWGNCAANSWCGYWVKGIYTYSPTVRFTFDGSIRIGSNRRTINEIANYVDSRTNLSNYEFVFGSDVHYNGTAYSTADPLLLNIRKFACAAPSPTPTPTPTSTPTPTPTGTPVPTPGPINVEKSAVAVCIEDNKEVEAHYFLKVTEDRPNNVKIRIVDELDEKIRELYQSGDLTFDFIIPDTGAYDEEKNQIIWDYMEVDGLLTAEYQFTLPAGDIDYQNVVKIYTPDSDEGVDKDDLLLNTDCLPIVGFSPDKTKVIIFGAVLVLIGTAILITKRKTKLIN